MGQGNNPASERWTAMILKTLFAAYTALALHSGAGAATLTLYDTNAADGARLANAAYAMQDMARMVRNGLARPVALNVDDYGAPTVSRFDVRLPVLPFAPTPGFSTRISRITWEVTARMSDGAVVYEVRIINASAWNDGIRPLRDVRTDSVTLSGQARPAGERVSFAQAYGPSTERRMLIGFLTP